MRQTHLRPFFLRWRFSHFLLSFTHRFRSSSGCEVPWGSVPAFPNAFAASHPPRPTAATGQGRGLLEGCVRKLAICRRLPCLFGQHPNTQRHPARLATEQISRPVGEVQDDAKAESLAGAILRAACKNESRARNDICVACGRIKPVQATSDSCGVRAHSLADWRLKPAP